MSLLEKIKNLITKNKKQENTEIRRKIKFSEVKRSPWAVSNVINRDEFRKMIKMYREDAVAYSKIIQSSKMSKMKHYTQGQIDAWDIMLEILSDL